MTDPALAAADAPDVAQRRRVLVAVGATALLALGGGGLVLLSGGGQAGTEATAPVQRSRAAATPTPSPTPAPPTALPPAPTPVSARNPYRPLYADTATGSAAVGAAGVAGPTPAASPTTTAAPAPVIPAPVIPPPVVVARASVPATAAPTTTPARYPLKLVRIRSSGNTALLTWTVDGKPLTTLDSQRFGLHGELVALSITKSSKGTLDVWVQAYAGTPFTIRVGQTRSVL